MGNEHQHTLINQNIRAINQEVREKKKYFFNSYKKKFPVQSFFFLNLSCENGINYMRKKNIIHIDMT